MERLERQNRIMKRVMFLALAVVSGLALMGQAPVPKVSDELRTRKLVVVDEAGKELAVLAAPKDGPSLDLSDAAGNVIWKAPQ